MPGPDDNYRGEREEDNRENERKRKRIERHKAELKEKRNNFMKKAMEYANALTHEEWVKLSGECILNRDVIPGFDIKLNREEGIKFIFSEPRCLKAFKEGYRRAANILEDGGESIFHPHRREEFDRAKFEEMDESNAECERLERELGSMVA